MKTILSCRTLGLSLVFLSIIANCFAIIPVSDSDKDDMVYLLGKWFYKNGKPNLSTHATEPEIFSQCMDHMNSSGCNTKWNQRYWVREDYYVPGGPIFFQFGGEGPADALIDAYYWHNYAQHYNAMLVVLEHRFYGQSYPSRDDSLETLQLLTSQQALADAAYFIEEFTLERRLNDSKWVAFGGSYAGNLAAWMKQKYPTHVATAVASSGPVLALYDFPGYLETCSEVVKAVDNECFEKIYDAFNCMESLVNGSTCGAYNSTSQIIPGLRQCNAVDFGDLLSREIFFLSLSMDMWAGNWPSQGIRSYCDSMKAFNGDDPINVYGDFLVEVGWGGNCKIKPKQNVAVKLLNFIRSEEGKVAGAAGWFWQTCYEFGYYMSADPKYGLFGYNTFSGWPYGSSCQYEFGSRFTKEYTESRIAMTNEYYKARDIDSNCVIFVNGNWDPWHTLGINDPSETTPENTVVHIKGAEHCDDMLNPKTDEMREAQALIQEQIGVYLNDPKC